MGQLASTNLQMARLDMSLLFCLAIVGVAYGQDEYKIKPGDTPARVKKKTIMSNLPYARVEPTSKTMGEVPPLVIAAAKRRGVTDGEKFGKRMMASAIESVNQGWVAIDKMSQQAQEILDGEMTSEGLLMKQAQTFAQKRNEETRSSWDELFSIQNETTQLELDKLKKKQISWGLKRESLDRNIKQAATDLANSYKASYDETLGSLEVVAVGAKSRADGEINAEHGKAEAYQGEANLLREQAIKVKSDADTATKAGRDAIVKGGEEKDKIRAETAALQGRADQAIEETKSSDKDTAEQEAKKNKVDTQVTETEKTLASFKSEVSKTHGAVLTEKSNLETMVSEDKDKEAAEKVKLDGINRAKAKSQADLAEASGVLAAKTADADTRETNNALKEKELTDQTKDHTEQVKVKEDSLGGLKTELDTLKAELQKQKDILSTKKRDATKAQGDASRADVAAKNAETRELSQTASANIEKTKLDVNQNQAEATQERRVEAGTKTDVVVAEEKSSGDQMKVLESEVKLLEESLKVKLAAAAAAAKKQQQQ